MKTITTRQLYKDNNICIRQRVIVDENNSILDKYISVRRVENGKVVENKSGIIQPTDHTYKIGAHTNKMVNLMLNNKYDYITKKVVEIAPNVYTIGEPIPVNEEALKYEKRVGKKPLQYENQISSDNGKLAKAFATLGRAIVVNIARETFRETYGKNSSVYFPVDSTCLKAINTRTNSFIEAQSKAKRLKGNVAKNVVEQSKPITLSELNRKIDLEKNQGK